MKGSFLLVAAAFLALATPALAGTKTYRVQPFERISVAAGITLDAQIGPARRVVAETDGSDFSDLRVAVQDGQLMIGRPNHWSWFGFGWGSGRPYHVRVAAPKLSGLSVSSSAAATVKGALSGDVVGLHASSSGRASVAEVRAGSVALHASSSGSLRIQDLQAGPVNLHASSSGHIAIDKLAGGAITAHASSSGGVDAAGTCQSLTAEASSSGRVGAGNLRCASVIAHAASGGSIAAFATKSFAGHASSGGHISVSGKPARVQMEKSSGGSIDVGS